MELIFYRKQVYGVEKVYLANERMAELVEVLTNRKTLNQNDFVALEALGHTLTEVLAPKAN